MGFLTARKLVPLPNGTSSISYICQPFCDPSTGGYCEYNCLPYCALSCPSRLPPPPPPPQPPPPPITFEHHPAQPNKLLITTITVLATTFFLACCYAMYVKFYLGSRRRRRRQQEEGGEEQRNETQDVFLDEDHGPVIDHPIWYINTVGLQPSVISSIAVCKYKRGEGLVEGTECSVCLNEFREDETLRLLPKCSHAFHIPCIDTWLRAHTNCPMCRAPIVTSTARSTPSSEANTGSSSTGDETRVAVEEIEREFDRAVESGDTGLRAVTREEGSELDGGNGGNSCEEDFAEVENGFQPLRRSISLDSLSAFKISQALANVTPREPDRNSRTASVTEDESNKEVASNGAGSSSRGLLNLMASSSIGRSLQIGPSSLVRSFSCSGKLLMSRYNQNRS